MVRLVRAQLGLASLSKGQRQQLEELLYQALLANGDVEAGVAELRRLIRSREPAPARNSPAQYLGALGLTLARLGQLTNHADWLEEGLACARQALRQKNGPEEPYWGIPPALPLASFLQKLGRGPEAEALLASTLAEVAGRMHQKGESANPGQPGAAAPILLQLVRLYHAAGRDADVLQLFDRAPYWGVGDLAQLGASEAYEYVPSYSVKHVPVPPGYYAAAALARTGRPAEAGKLLKALFAQSPGCDRLYELLLALDDEHAPAQLDALFARDQFEERPLIWKANWLRLHQRLEEAERAARQAIAIDPTDGEEGPGDRLRAYAELAEIRAARGDQTEAGILRGAVQAVHQAETADGFNEAGLLKQAVAMYQDSLTHFADAYCIHARLAVQLSDLGQHEQAEEHYRRAYELMPDSFGRVESHCFGCERAFDGERAQGIAEKVFMQLAQKTPDKPQVHYLLGYLREEQSRYKEALESYRTAVKLDPDYLNAWVKIESISSHVYLPAAERDAVVFNLLRLDPLYRRGMPSFELVTDLAALWRKVAVANAKRPVQPASLYALPASRVEVEKLAAQAGGVEARMERELELRRGEGEDAPSPGRVLARNGFVRAALHLLGSDVARAWER